jgi:O-antigen/teichoic acid export membrane protein
MINKLFNSEVFKNIGILVSGTVLAQLIPVISQVFLRRMYSPEEFGAYSIICSLIGISVLFFTLRYDLAIVNPKSHVKALNIFALIFFIATIFLVLSFTSILCFKEIIIEWLDFPEKFTFWLYLLPFIIYLMAIYKALEYWLIRMKKFKIISFNKLVRRGAESFIQLILGVLNVPTGLILGNFSGNIFNLFIGLAHIKKTSVNIRLITKERILSLIKDYKEYPLYSFIPSLLNTVALLLPILFVNKLFGLENTAQLDLTSTVLAVPSVFLAIAVSQVYLQKFSEMIHQNKSLKIQFFNMFLSLVIISFAILITIYFFGEEIFTLIFGNKWTLAGSFSEILIYKYALVFLVSPLSCLLIALKKIKIISIWQILYFISIIQLYYFDTNTMKEFLNLYVKIDVLAYLAYFILIAFSLIRYENKLI